MTKQNPTREEIKEAKDLLLTRTSTLVETNLIQKCQIIGSSLGVITSEWTADFEYNFNSIKILHNGTGFYRGCDELSVYYQHKLVLNATEDHSTILQYIKYPQIIFDKTKAKPLSEWDHFWVNRYHPGEWENELEEKYNTLTEENLKHASRGKNLFLKVSPEFINGVKKTKLTLEDLSRIHEKFDSCPKLIHYYGI